MQLCKWALCNLPVYDIVVSFLWVCSHIVVGCVCAWGIGFSFSYGSNTH